MGSGPVFTPGSGSAPASGSEYTPPYGGITPLEWEAGIGTAAVAAAATLFLTLRNKRKDNTPEGEHIMNGVSAKVSSATQGAVSFAKSIPALLGRKK